MCEPTGLGAFARRFPDRFYDVGIAEQHAVTSAAGLASGGLHPVVAIYATFLNRAFDQVLLDVALHRLPVTFVLDRAGHHRRRRPEPQRHVGSRHARRRARAADRRAARRDDAARRSCARRSSTTTGRPSCGSRRRRWAATCRRVRRVGGVDVLAEPTSTPSVDVLVVAVGRDSPPTCWTRPARSREAGFTVRVVDPRWVTPVAPELVRSGAGPPVWS